MHFVTHFVQGLLTEQYNVADNLTQPVKKFCSCRWRSSVCQSSIRNNIACFLNHKTTFASLIPSAQNDGYTAMFT